MRRKSPPLHRTCGRTAHPESSLVRVNWVSRDTENSANNRPSKIHAHLYWRQEPAVASLTVDENHWGRGGDGKDLVRRCPVIGLSVFRARDTCTCTCTKNRDVASGDGPQA